MENQQNEGERGGQANAPQNRGEAQNTREQSARPENPGREGQEEPGNVRRQEQQTPGQPGREGQEQGEGQEQDPRRNDPNRMDPEEPEKNDPTRREPSINEPMGRKENDPASGEGRREGQ